MSAVSIKDMENFAIGGDSLRFDADMDNVIELDDLQDDLTTKILFGGADAVGGPKDSNIHVTHASNDTGRSIKIDSFIPSNNKPSNSLDIDTSPLEPLEPISLGVNFDTPAPMNDFQFHKEPEVQSFSSPFSNSQSASTTGIQLATSNKDPEAEKKEKGDYINKLQRLEQKGFPVARKFTMDNSLDEIKTEYFRLVDARNLETSIKFQRQMLMGAITGLEWLNGRFDPFDLKLEGWSESVHENVEDFDEIFEELYDKYKDKGKMSPEMRLIMAVGGSGFMCHVSNSFFRSKMPSMDDVLRRNPELARQMAAAAAQQAGPGFGNFMGMAMGVNNQPVGAPTSGFPANGGPPLSGVNPMGPTNSAQATNNFQQPSVAQTGAFFSATNVPMMQPQSVVQEQANKPVARREMSGPSGVDDILRTFEEVRRAEMKGEMNMSPATGFKSQPAVSAVMSGAVSVASGDDFLSQAESSRTGGATGRRRKKTQVAVGNTIALDV